MNQLGNLLFVIKSHNVSKLYTQILRKIFISKKE
jgi:hypothetical protein